MYKMDLDRYYQDQINKSTYNRLNKVSDFTENQTKGQEGGFLTHSGGFKNSLNKSAI